MKTTVELSDELLRAARALATREGITLRAVLERGLLRVIAEAKIPRTFRLRDASVDGDGLAPEVKDSWDSIRARIYEGRGG